MKGTRVPRFLPRLRRLLASGETLASAGQQLGISKSAAQRWIARFGMDAMGRRREAQRLTIEQTHQIISLRKRGGSIRSIALRLEIDRKTVRRHAGKADAVYRCPTCGGKTKVSPCLVCSVSSPV